MEKRQEKILKYIVKEYIKTAEPVSSKVLAEKYNMKASPATIRWDMVELVEKGYLLQLYTSSGRVPTEKAYRFFIEKFCDPKLSSKTEKKIEELFFKKEEDKIKKNETIENEIIKELGELIALISRNVSIVVFGREIFWQGFSYLLSQPEFYEPDEILEATKTFENLYQRIRNEEFLNKEIKIYIGKENPFDGDENLTLILGGLENGVIGILGPKRMDYQQNIALVKKSRELIRETLSLA